MIENIISVVTVVYNAEKTIGKTIDSLLKQTYSSMEYIIIDGLSSDGTMDIVKEKENLIKNKVRKFMCLSEPDNGIYDAMNKALRYCTGSWVYFLNADDSFARDDSLQCLCNEITGEEACVYGNTINVFNNQKYVRKSYNMSTVGYRVPFIHQAAIVKRETMEKYLFDTSISLAADYDLWIRMYLNKEVFKYVDVEVAYFSMSGASQVNVDISRKECLQLQKRYGFNKRNVIKRFYVHYVTHYLKKSQIIYYLYRRLHKAS